MAGNGARTTAMLAKTQINLKLISRRRWPLGNLPACRLQSQRYYREGVVAWATAAPRAACRRLSPIFPSGIFVGAHHVVADVTLPYSRVLHDDNKI